MVKYFLQWCIIQLCVWLLPKHIIACLCKIFMLWKSSQSGGTINVCVYMPLVLLQHTTQKKRHTHTFTNWHQHWCVRMSMLAAAVFFLFVAAIDVVAFYHQPSHINWLNELGRRRVVAGAWCFPCFFCGVFFFCDSFLFFYYTFFFGGMRCSQNLFSFCTRHKSLCAQEDGMGIVFF